MYIFILYISLFFIKSKAAGKRPFLRVVLLQHKFVSAARRILESGQLVLSLGTRAYEVYESNIELNLRFMVDTDVVSAKIAFILNGLNFNFSFC